MSKYDITRSCGHVEVIDISGTNVRGERGARATWEAKRQCKACYLVARAQESAAASVDQTLPALSGSDKQIAWASTIRHNALSDYEQWIARYPADQRDEVADEWRELLLSQTEARFWIDNRGRSAKSLLHDLVVS